MKGWRTAMALGLVFAAQTALADQAKTRESGSSGSSSAGERHHSSGSGASSRSSDSGSSSRSSDSGRAYESSSSRSAGARHHSSDSGASSRSRDSRRAHESSRGTSASSSRSSHPSRVSEARARPLTQAERRHPRPGTGTGYRYRYYPYSGYRYGYDPYYYSGYRPYYGYYGYWGFSPWYYGSSWDGGWGYSYSSGPHHYYGYPRSRYSYDDDMGAVRLLVEPEETKVLVDGYYAGEVDDFDGIFQRLQVAPGRHEITLKLQGYQTHRVKVYVPRDETLKIHHRMLRGAETEITEENLVRPGDEERAQQTERYSQRRDRDDDEDAENDEEDTGTVRLDVEPRDASVYVDGEFQGAGREARRLELAAGHHRIEIVRPGYRTAERDVEVKSGRSEDLEVRLEK